MKHMLISAALILLVSALMIGFNSSKGCRYAG